MAEQAARNRINTSDIYSHYRSTNVLETLSLYRQHAPSESVPHMVPEVYTARNKVTKESGAGEDRSSLPRSVPSFLPPFPRLAPYLDIATRNTMPTAPPDRLIRNEDECERALRRQLHRKSNVLAQPRAAEARGVESAVRSLYRLSITTGYRPEAPEDQDLATVTRKAIADLVPLPDPTHPRLAQTAGEFIPLVEAAPVAPKIREPAVRTEGPMHVGFYPLLGWGGLPSAVRNDMDRGVAGWLTESVLDLKVPAEDRERAIHILNASNNY